jgi:hypothetical protein
VLQIGGRARDSLQSRGGSPEGAVGRLRHTIALVLGLLEQMHESQAVLGQDHAVGIEREDVVGVRDHEVGGVKLAGRHERATRGSTNVAVAASHQADIAVQVHRCHDTQQHQHSREDVGIVL